MDYSFKSNFTIPICHDDIKSNKISTPDTSPKNSKKPRVACFIVLAAHCPYLLRYTCTFYYPTPRLSRRYAIYLLPIRYIAKRKAHFRGGNFSRNDSGALANWNPARFEKLAIAAACSLFQRSRAVWFIRRAAESGNKCFTRASEGERDRCRAQRVRRAVCSSLGMEGEECAVASSGWKSMIAGERGWILRALRVFFLVPISIVALWFCQCD